MIISTEFSHDHSSRTTEFSHEFYMITLTEFSHDHSSRMTEFFT